MEYVKSLISNFSIEYLTPLLFFVIVLLALNAVTFYHSRNREENQIVRLFKKYNNEDTVMIRSTDKTNGLNTYILESNHSVKKVCMNRFGKIKEVDLQ